MPSTKRGKPSPRKQENALDGFYGSSLTSAAASSSSTSINATVGNANRIGLNGDEESNNVITQEQIAHCKANRLNALAIRERKMLQNSVTSTAVNGGSHGALTMEQIERKNSNRSIALAIREQNEQALQLDLDATRIRVMVPSITTATYDAGSKRPFSASNNDDVSTNARGGGDYGSAFGESIALLANAKTKVERRMPSFISSGSRQSSFAVEESYSLANPEALRTTTTTANNSELMSSLSSSSILLPWESGYSPHLVSVITSSTATSTSASMHLQDYATRSKRPVTMSNSEDELTNARVEQANIQVSGVSLSYAREEQAIIRAAGVSSSCSRTRSLANPKALRTIMTTADNSELMSSLSSSPLSTMPRLTPTSPIVSSVGGYDPMKYICIDIDDTSYTLLYSPEDTRSTNGISASKARS